VAGLVRQRAKVRRYFAECAAPELPGGVVPAGGAAAAGGRSWAPAGRAGVAGVAGVAGAAGVARVPGVPRVACVAGAAGAAATAGRSGWAECAWPDAAGAGLFAEWLGWLLTALASGGLPFEDAGSRLACGAWPWTSGGPGVSGTGGAPRAGTASDVAG